MLTRKKQEKNKKNLKANLSKYVPQICSSLTRKLEARLKRKKVGLENNKVRLELKRLVENGK
ncbi:TPA: hypothetical protein ACGO63_002027 [Streptococcus suis]